jgi:2-polyprenyl-3-methyl-5-hydroxy-6-metoxy-1,4-benzoquinol methylase
MQSADELANRLFESRLGALDLVSVYIGDRLGFYRALVEGGSATSAELATRASTDERYTREWLEQQAVTGILAVDDPAADAKSRRFRFPDEYVTVLLDPVSPLASAAKAQSFVGVVAPLEAVVAAFRSGAGVPYGAYGQDLREGQARGNRPDFHHRLATEWIAALPDVAARLRAMPPARVADIGMGQGWSSIAIAAAFPTATVDGFDLDDASVEAARINAIEAGVADRVAFHARDAGDPMLTGRYDFALAIECIHDMADPIGVLVAMRRLVGSGGVVLVVDEKVADAFVAPGEPIERVMYGYSILHCLPVGRVERPSAETGTIIREATMRRYVAEAGFRAAQVLPVAHDAFRFYRLTA